jgi:hypothetical protein
MSFKPKVADRLEALDDSSGKSVFIGRSQQVHRTYGREGALLLGTLTEDDRFGEFVYLDALAPHVVFISGARGSGKSYTLGVIAEELNSKNPNVASVIIDPIGIYWSMKYPNQDAGELDNLIRMGLSPRGVDHVNIFVPYGVRDTLPRDTYDRVYAMRPADLTVDDWCLTFDIDRFSPTGLLLEKSLEKVAQGYVNNDNKHVHAKEGAFGIDDIVDCLQSDRELTGKVKGFRTESRRALISRFEAAKSWGVFTADGTPLAELCKEGEVSVIDVSFLDERVTSLVIGLLARKILNARKLATRKMAMKRLDVNVETVLETEIPPTWLFIDEAHTLIPSGSEKTAATDPLIEYVKQGRRPGCSLVFATQQPSAIDTRVLSQLDVLVCHKLVFDDDLKAVFRRMPTPIPKEYSSRFIKTLPIGSCLVGDRSDHTSRAFTLTVRPRFSQHEGRETRSVEFEEGITKEDVQKALVKMVVKEVTDLKRMNVRKIEQLVATINKRYNTSLKPKDVIDSLLADQCVLDGQHLMLRSEFDKEQALEHQEDAEAKDESVPMVAVEGAMLAFRPVVSSDRAMEAVRARQKTKLFGLFGSEERVESFALEYWPVYKVSYDHYEKSGFRRSHCYVDGMTGEVLSAGKAGLETTTNLSALVGMTRNKRKICMKLRRAKRATAKGLAGLAEVTETTARANADELVKGGVLQETSDGKAVEYTLKMKLDLPETILDAAHSNLESSFVMEESKGKVVQPRVSKDSVADVPSIWGEVRVKEVSFVYRPVYHARLSSVSGARELFVDGLTGREIRVA